MDELGGDGWHEGAAQGRSFMVQRGLEWSHRCARDGRFRAAARS
ncbi:MAG TPA: hypothetical protein VK790_04130 [Solirubrobacteraceae bacterium]|nr:hypothetical protein [Solirubrobacteraceae bacterium]